MSLQLRPTFSESWYRVQSLKPKLRVGAQISRQFYRGERWYVVRDPAGNQYHRLSDAAYAFVGLLDGHRSVAEAWELVGGQLADDAPTQPEVIQILSQLYAANLIETNISPDATVLLRRHKKQVAQKTKGRLMNILFPRIPLWDPDWFLKQWMPVMRHVISPIGGVIWLLLIGTSLVFLLPYIERLWSQGAETVNFSADPINAVWLGIAFVVLKFIHEMGHGFMCRRFGGECHELGVMFLVLFPAPYVDASSAWSFPNKWHRILVGAGGMIFELAVAAVAGFVWLWTKDNTAATWFNTMAYNVLLISSVSTVVFNANPLLRYDGYYILSDLLEMPNLQYRSREYSLYLIKRYLFRVKWSQPVPHGLRTKLWLLFYNYTSAPYRILVGVTIMIFVLYQLPPELKILGMILFVGSLATFLIVPLFKTVKYLALDPEMHRHRLLGWTYTLGAAAIIFAVIGVFKFHVPFFDVRGQAILLADQREPVFPLGVGKGMVSQVFVKDGDVVKAGDPLFQLENRDLVTRRLQILAQIDQYRVEMKSAEQDDPAKAMSLFRQIEGLERQRQTYDEYVAQLTVRAKTDGTVIAPELASMVGKWISGSGDQNGKPYAEVVDTRRLIAYTLISNSDYQLVNEALRQEQDGKIRRAFTSQVRLASDPTATIDQKRVGETVLGDAATHEVRSPLLTQVAGGKFQIDPSDPSGKRLLTPEFEVRIPIDNQDRAFLPGQRAEVRVRFDEDRTILWHVMRLIRQSIQTTRTS
jgi:putative peptide zinc metalloprotease protein